MAKSNGSYRYAPRTLLSGPDHHRDSALDRRPCLIYGHMRLQPGMNEEAKVALQAGRSTRDDITAAAH